MKRTVSALLLVVACGLGLCGCGAYDNIGASMKNDPAFDFPAPTLRSPSDQSSSSGSTSSSFPDR